MRLGCTGLRVLAVFFTVLMVSANTLEIVLSPGKPKIGGSVTFNVPGITEGIRFFDWYRGNDTSSANQIIRFNNRDGSTSRGQKAIATASVFPNASLQITNLTKALEDKYMVEIQGDATLYQGTVFLVVDDSNPVHPVDSDHLSAGAIAGIVISILVVLIAASIGAAYAFKSKESGPL